MKWKHVLLIGVCAAVPIAVALAVLQRPQPETRYDVLYLPNLNGIRVTARAINDREQVVGTAEVPPQQLHLWLWDRDAGMRDLGPYPWPMRAGSLYLNNAGHIAGTGSGFAFLIDPNGTRRFLYLPRGGTQNRIQTIVVEPNAAQSAGYPVGEEIRVQDLDDRGRIVGYCSGAGRSRRGFVWDRRTGMQDLPIPGAVESVAAGINDLGQIVGSYSAQPGGPWTVFLWDPNTGVQDLGPAGGGSVHMCDINNRSFVVGRFDASGDKSTISIWGPDKGLRTVCPDRGAAVQTEGLNDTNRFLALTHRERFSLREFSRLTDLDSYLWDPNEGFVELGRVLGRRDVIEFFATGINNKGQIVGSLRLKNEPNPLAVLLEPMAGQVGK